jgi:head-tail adaptor
MGAGKLNQRVTLRGLSGGTDALGQPVAELPRCFWEGLLDPFWVPGV